MCDMPNEKFSDQCDNQHGRAGGRDEVGLAEFIFKLVFYICFQEDTALAEEGRQFTAHACLEKSTNQELFP